MTIYKEGDAVFLCESHASSVGNSEAPTIAGVRLIQTESSTGSTSSSVTPFAVAPEEQGAPSASAAAPEPEMILTNEAATVEAPVQAPQGEVPKTSEPAVAEPQAVSEATSAATEAERDTAESGEPIRDAEPIHSRQAELFQPSDFAAPEPAPAAASAPRRETARPAAKALVRDFTYGDCAKALVDEAIWNLEAGDYEAYRTALFEGKSTAEAAQAAGGQLAIVLRRINEYATKLEGLLSESEATIDPANAIDKPLEQAMLDIISDSGLSEAEKDAAVDHLGALQKEIHSGLDGVISPLQAHRITIAIAERVNWGARSSLAEELKPAYRALYSSVRKAMVGAVPEARIFDERLANLYAAKSDIASAPSMKAMHSAAR